MKNGKVKFSSMVAVGRKQRGRAVFCEEFFKLLFIL